MTACCGLREERAEIHGAGQGHSGGVFDPGKAAGLKATPDDTLEGHAFGADGGRREETAGEAAIRTIDLDDPVADGGAEVLPCAVECEGKIAYLLADGEMATTCTDNDTGQTAVSEGWEVGFFWHILGADCA